MYACNCAKDEQKRLSVRRYAGVFVTVLPCGHVVTLHHLLGAESLPQVALCFAQALHVLPDKKYLCYDNACALARYCRNPVRSTSSAGAQKLRDCIFFLPESHVRGHTACLDPASNYYSPEVRKGSHSILAGVNSEAQEQVFAWVRWLIYVANPMTPTRHRVFFLLLCIARGAHLLQPAPTRRRPRRGWACWRGARATALRAASDVVSADSPATPAAPQQLLSAPPPHARYALNLRDKKLHRLAGPASLCCGATMPKRCLHVDTRDDLGRRSLCMRNGCFSPGATL